MRKDEFPLIEAYADSKVNEVLNKIRAEIQALSNANPSYWHGGDMVDRDDVLEIIDSYKDNGGDK